MPRHSGLAIFVDQFGEWASSHMTELWNAEQKANWVENVTLPRSIQTCNCIEQIVKIIDHCSLCVTLNIEFSSKQTFAKKLLV